MSPNEIIIFIKSWLELLIPLASGVIAASSIAVKIVASYIQSRKDMDITYKPSKFTMFLLAALQALSINSNAAHNLLAESAKVQKTPPTTN